MKIKFNLGWILAIAGAIGLAAMAFMSFYYATSGQLVTPIIVAVCLLLLPILVSMYLVPAKECRQPFYFHSSAVKEAILLVSMIVLFFVSMFLTNHFFTVNSRTEKIAGIVENQRRQYDDMQASYSKHVETRTENYRNYLKEVKNNMDQDLVTYNKVFPNGSSDIDIMVRDMSVKISPRGLKDSTSTVYGKESLSWWQLPTVMNNVESISSMLEKNYNLMVECDHNFGDDNLPDEEYWSYTYTKAADIMTEFTQKDGLVTSLWTVLSVIVAYLLIMLPYITAERDLRSKGLLAELKDNLHDDYDDDDDKDDEGIGVIR